MYIQEESADIWRKDILADLKLGVWKFLLVKKLLITLKGEFGEEDDKLAKVTELKQLE